MTENENDKTESVPSETLAKMGKSELAMYSYSQGAIDVAVVYKDWANEVISGLGELTNLPAEAVEAVKIALQEVIATSDYIVTKNVQLREIVVGKLVEQVKSPHTGTDANETGTDETGTGTDETEFVI